MSYAFADDGSLILKARLPGALSMKAIDAAMESIPTEEIIVDTDRERPISYGARRADALAVVAESFLESAATSSNAADRYQVVVRIDADTLYECFTGRCGIEHGPPISAETARRLTCDASLISVLENEQG